MFAPFGCRSVNGWISVSVALPPLTYSHAWHRLRHHPAAPAASSSSSILHLAPIRRDRQHRRKLQPTRSEQRLKINNEAETHQHTVQSKRPGWMCHKLDNLWESNSALNMPSGESWQLVLGHDSWQNQQSRRKREEMGFLENIGLWSAIWSDDMSQFLYVFVRNLLSRSPAI